MYLYFARYPVSGRIKSPDLATQYPTNFMYILAIPTFIDEGEKISISTQIYWGHKIGSKICYWPKSIMLLSWVADPVSD